MAFWAGRLESEPAAHHNPPPAPGTMRKSTVSFLSLCMLLTLFGLVWTALPQEDAPLEPGVTPSSASSDSELSYLPVAFGMKTETVGIIFATPTESLVPPDSIFVDDNYTVRDDGRGRIQIIGEVVNDAKVPVRSLAVTATLYDGAGDLLESSYAPAQLDNLPEGERTCFVISFEAADGWSRIAFGEPTFATDVDVIPDLDVREVETGYDSIMGWYTLSGQVINREEEPAELVQLVGSLYDGSGRITGCAFAFVGSTHLKGQEQSQFEMLFTGHDFADVASHKLQVEGWAD